MLCLFTKLHQGDWKRLRDDIDEAAESVTDLAASADIEDIMPRDLEDVLVFLNLPADTPLPSGRKGKVRMKRLFRMVAVNHPYMKRRRRDLSCKLLIWARLRRGHPCLSADLKARSLVRARGKCKFWGPKIYTSSCGNDVCPVGIFPLRGHVSFY
jgi:hypothetical protein